MAGGTNLATAYVQIIPTTKGIKNNLKTELDAEGTEAGESSGKNTGESFVKKMIKIIAAAKIGEKIVSGIKASIEAGAALEQSIGGIETLFKDSADTMIEYANNAYKTAGVSANDYMEQATSFSASLLSGLGGDTAKAAEYANRAITDMADNSNKMGTNLTDIQNAYQGFAKQNYTMLDNLKLGYGGTQAEMQRLIADASKMTDVQKELGLTVDSSSMSFDNIINAISVMQKSMDITGTTSLEAASTLSGSLGMMKASWTNFLAELSVGDGADVNRAMKNFASSAATFLFDNLIPAIGNIFKNLPGAIAAFFKEAFPSFKKFGSQIIEKIKEGWQNRDGHIKDAINATLDNALTWLTESFPEILDKGIEAVKNFADGIGQGDGSAAEAVGEIVGKILKVIGMFAGQLALAGLEMAGELIVGFINALPSLLQKLGAFLGSMLETALGGIREAVATKIEELKENVRGKMSALLEYLTQPFRDAWNAIVTIFEGIKTSVSSALESVKTTVTTILNAIKTVFTTIWNAIKTVVSTIAQAIKTVVLTPINAMKTAISTVLNGIKTLFSTVWNGIKTSTQTIVTSIKSAIVNPIMTAKNTVVGILNSIKEAFTEKLNAAKDKVKAIIDKIRSFFNFSWSLPKLKMPHLSISGKFSISPPSVPKFSISWYKKAMDDGMILNSPTIFGASGGNLLGAGEAGSETVVGTHSLMDMISNSVNSASQSDATLIAQVIELLQMYLPGMANTQLVLDGGALVGQIAPSMDRELGKLQGRRERGR